MSRQIALVSLLLTAIQTFCIADENLSHQIRYLGKTQVSGTAVDLSSDISQLEDGSPSNRLGALGSGISWSGKGDLYAMISDRGPGDGATSFRCRIHLVEVSVNPKQQNPVTLSLRSTVLLSTGSGQPLVGLASAISGTSSSTSNRFDPEAIRVTPAGTFLLAEEYGPSITEFNQSGTQIGQTPLPPILTPNQSSALPEEELPPHNLHGRQPNRGLESLAMSNDGRTLFTVSQSPLIQDHAVENDNKRIGTNL